MPGINLIRIANYQLNTPASYAPFVNVMTANHVVVVFEPHNVGGVNLVNSGAALTTLTNWFASVASYYIGNPYVWFQSSNEPGYTGDFLESTANYNAVLGNVKNSPVFFESWGGASGDPSNLGSSTFTNSMHNIGWDIHLYDWQSGFSSNLTTITNDQNARVAAMQTITSGDGVMPVICLETGNSAAGSSIDPGGAQVVQAAYANPNLIGNAAWIWDSIYTSENDAIDNLTNAGGASLNSYGTQVAGFVASGASTFPASAGPISGATASSYVPVPADVGTTLTVAVVANNAGGSSAPATSAATSAVIAAAAGPPPRARPRARLSRRRLGRL
jgi:hypothetical protein